jgi:hypothetical protein
MTLTNTRPSKKKKLLYEWSDIPVRCILYLLEWIDTKQIPNTVNERFGFFKTQTTMTHYCLFQHVLIFQQTPDFTNIPCFLEIGIDQSDLHYLNNWIVSPKHKIKLSVGCNSSPPIKAPTAFDCGSWDVEFYVSKPNKIDESVVQKLASREQIKTTYCIILYENNGCEENMINLISKHHKNRMCVDVKLTLIEYSFGPAIEALKNWISSVEFCDCMSVTGLNLFLQNNRTLKEATFRINNYEAEIDLLDVCLHMQELAGDVEWSEVNSLKTVSVVCPIEAGEHEDVESVQVVLMNCMEEILFTNNSVETLKIDFQSDYFLSDTMLVYYGVNPKVKTIEFVSCEPENEYLYDMMYENKLEQSSY